MPGGVTQHSPSGGRAGWHRGTRGPPQLRAEHAWGDTHPRVLPLLKTLLRLPREGRPVDLKTQRTCWSREGDSRDPALQIHIPRLPMAWGRREGQREGPTEPTQPRPPTLQPREGPFLLRRCTPAVTAHSQAGLEWSCWDGWSRTGRGWTCGWPGERVLGDSREQWSPSPPPALGSSRTKGSLGTQALDPITVTQHAKGHFISFSAFFC